MMLWLATTIRWRQRPDRLLFITGLLLATLLAGCTALPSTTHSKLDMPFQISTLRALQAAVNDGERTVAQWKQQGDAALGIFRALDTDQEPSGSVTPIVLGALYNLSGAQAGLDLPSAQGAQLAVDAMNRAGGLLGRPVDLVIADGESDPAVIAAKTDQLLAEHPTVTAFLGLSDTDMVLGAAPVAAAAQRLFLTSGATSPQLPAHALGYLYLACFGDNVQAAAAAEWAYEELSARSAAILYNTDMLYTQGLERYFATRFAELGGAIVSTQSYATDDLISLQQAVDSLTTTENKADIIFVAAGPDDAPTAARLLRVSGFTAPIVGGDGFDIGALWEQYAELDNVYFTTHAYLGADSPNPTVQAFRDAYLTHYPGGKPDAFTALGYDAANLLMTAMSNAQSADPAVVRAALANIENFDGVTGRITYRVGNPIPRKSVTILALDQGEYRYVSEVMPVSVPAPDIADTTPRAEADPIKIGVLNPTSGPLAPFGQDVTIGIERFFEAWGSASNGRPIELIMADTAGEATQAVTAAQRLVEEEGVDLLMGIVNSSAAGPVADFADERQIPLVITIAGAEEVTGLARSPYVFRTAMANGQQERPLAIYLATQMGRQRAATIAWDFPAGAERSAAFADAFTAAGGVVVQTLQPPLGTDDFGVYLDALDPNEIDLLYAFLTGPQAADFMHQLRQRAGFADLLVVGPGYLTAGVLPQMGTDALPMMQAVEYTSAMDSPEHNAVIQSLLNDASRALPSYIEKVRATSDVYVMEGYLGASVVAQALAATDGDVENGERFLEALAAVDFASVSGPFRFDAQGQAVRNLYITELVAGQSGEIGPELREVIQDVTQSQNAASPHQPEQTQEELPAIAIPLDHPSAPFLESYRYAVQAGATAEWRKMEGVAYDPVSNRLYVAMSEVNQGMTDGHGDIDVAANPCGAIYAADLDADYDLVALHAVISGGPYDERDLDNPCNSDNIANPDNLAVDSRGNLWIAEDTDAHANNMLWMFDSETLHRYATLPMGAEVTGLHIDANDTLFMNTSHPDGANLYPYNRALTGVIQGYRAGTEFASLPLPQGDARHAIQLAAGVYQPLGRTGEAIPHSIHGHRFGQITLADGEDLLCNRADGNMYLPTNAAGSEGYLFTNYECAPGGVSMLYIRQGADGEWEVLEGDMVDFMAVNGSWRNCFASVTPWNTALSSEEAPPAVDAAWIETHKPMSDYLGRLANPYDYGYTMELTPGQLGADVTKHYVMGRTSHEISLVMPDARTVYQSDDGSDRLLWKFVADAAGDLTAGTLYAAKATQRDATDGGKFTIEWIELGSSDNERIGADIRQLDAAIAELE
ncbi:MAG: ABC transporter substrate-binding protein [Caldilineaceae bacterium]